MKNIKRINPEFLNVLRILYKIFKNSDINWSLTGSMSFFLQGIKIIPDDIDIQTDKSGAFEIESTFREFVVKGVEFKETKRIRSYFGSLIIDGIKVEIMGDIQKKLKNGVWENPVDINKHKKFIEFEGMKIPVLSLEYEENAYRIMGRDKKADIIKDYLEKT